MDLIERFIARYRKEYDFYDQASRLVAEKIEVSLQAAGIRSMVTSRAKFIVRLEEKVRQRAGEKNYLEVDDIYKDIVDLAGARVALYFPGDRERVGTLISSLFTVVGTPIPFPKKATSAHDTSYEKRFSGYWATHYRVQLLESSLTDTQKRYAEARVEIQVASVLMHAWSEVEHDLVYKPLQGSLSKEELAILDELNGLVIAGEIALERLQRAGEARVAAKGRRFGNHYDLAAHLIDRASTILKGPLGDSALGRVDLLFELLTRLNMATPDSLAPYIAALHADTERRPVAEQIVDQILAENENRYAEWNNVRRTKLAVTEPAQGTEYDAQVEVHEAIGYFISRWTAFERRIREIAKRAGASEGPVFMPAPRVLEKLGLFDTEERRELDRIRRLRNDLVHGITIPDVIDIRSAADRLSQIMGSLPPEDDGD